MRFPFRRRVAALTAAAAAVALGLGAGAGSADAAGASPVVVTLAPLAPLALAAGAPATPSLDWTPSRHLPGFQQVTLTVDARGLAKVAKVSFSSGCQVTGLVASCPDQFDLQSGDMGESAPFTLAPLAGAKLGTAGSYTIAGTGTGLTIHGGAGRVVVGGPEYFLNPLGRHTGVRVGATVTQPITFSNLGNMPANGSEVALVLSPGLRFAQHYSNCDYRTLVRNRQSYEDSALCHFSTWMRTGEKVAFAQPVGTVVTAQALWTYLDVVAAPAGDQAVLQWVVAPAPGVSWHRGSGPVLHLKPLVAGTPSSAPAGVAELPSENQGYQIESIAARNTADYGVTGSSAKAAKGANVALPLWITNHGPAVLYDRSGGEGTPYVKVTLPPGTTLVGNADCSAATSTVAYCSAGLPAILAWPGQSFHLTLTLHVNKVVAHARGLVQLVWGGGPVPSTTIPFDPNPRNNTAALLLN